MLVVIDTNVLVSALWSRNGAPARVVSMVLTDRLIPCYDYRILAEYRQADKKFFEVAKFCGAILITGNLKHFPEDPQVMSVAAFLEYTKK